LGFAPNQLAATNSETFVPRARNNENRGYPKSWRFRYDAYYYRVPKGQEQLWDGKKEFNLGRSLSEAAAEWAKRLNRIEHDATIDALLTRYQPKLPLHGVAICKP
jgi:hypothetical protein